MGHVWVENTGAFRELGILVFYQNMAEHRSSPGTLVPRCHRRTPRLPLTRVTQKDRNKTRFNPSLHWSREALVAKTILKRFQMSFWCHGSTQPLRRQNYQKLPSGEEGEHPLNTSVQRGVSHCLCRVGSFQGSQTQFRKSRGHRLSSQELWFSWDFDLFCWTCEPHKETNKCIYFINASLPVWGYLIISLIKLRIWFIRLELVQQ